MSPIPNAIIALLPVVVIALDNGFGRTPVMGFNTYNDVGCSPNSSYVSSTISALASKGFNALGYEYFQIDCGWQGYKRLQNGSMTYDSSVFPNGILPLSKQANDAGFIWSMYTDQGVKSCDTKSSPLRPGSLGYEKQDAAMFAAWRAAYVKVDNCYVTAGQNAPKDPRTDFPQRYGAISSALQSVGIKGIMVCEWGTPYQNTSTNTLQGPYAWTPPLANSYRVSDDIATGWANVMRIMNEAIHVNLRGLSGPSSFADMDLLEVGNSGMTFAEQQTHYSVWALFKSALFVSTNIQQMSTQTFGILSNKDVIAINQDPLGQPVKLVQRFTGDYDVFAGDLANGDIAVLLLDQSNTKRTLAVNFSELGVASANVKELWSGDSKTAATAYSRAVDAHGPLILRLSSIKKATSSTPKLTYYEAEAGSLAGGANIASCTGCSRGKKVGNLGSGASITINNVNIPSATSSIRFDYINCEIGYLSDQGPNTRYATISVNGGTAQEVSFPVTGYNWDVDVTKGYLVKLGGFRPGAGNTIVIGSDTGKSQYAPDFDRIAVVS